MLTPRNSNGACTWCVVEKVRFQYNLVRNVAAGINLLGRDSRPTGQSNNISFVHNVFTKMNTSLGGNARFLQMDAGPRDVSIEHNTIDSNGSSVVYVVGGTSTDPTEVYGFRMIANAARHGSYGIFGAFFGYGNDIIAHYFPDAVIEANYLAGAPAARYLPPIIIPFPPPSFDDQFVNTAEEDYTLRPTTKKWTSPRERRTTGARRSSWPHMVRTIGQSRAPPLRSPGPARSPRRRPVSPPRPANARCNPER